MDPHLEFGFNTAPAEAKAFDIAAERWDPVPELPGAPFGNQAAVLNGRVYFGDGTGHFERRSEVQDAPGVELLTVDLDDDGGTDLLAFAEAARVVRGARAEGLSSAILAAPPGMRSVNPVDVDGDGRRDLIGVAGDGIVVLRSLRGLELEQSSLVDLPLHAGTPRALWAGRSESGLRLVVLTRLAGDSEPFTLVLLSGVESPQVDATATVVSDAPLTLRYDVR